MLGNGDARNAGANRSDRAAVAHDDDSPLGVRARNPLERWYDSGCQLVIGLAARPAGPAGSPCGVRIGEPRVDLLAGQALPVAHVDLAELAQHRHGKPESLAQDVGRLARPEEVARVDRVGLDGRSARPRAPEPARAPSRSAADPRVPGTAARRSSPSRRDARSAARSRHYASRHGSRPSRPRLPRHRLDRRHRARDRAPPDRGRRPRRHSRARRAAGNRRSASRLRRPSRTRRAPGCRRGGRRASTSS